LAGAVVLVWDFPGLKHGALLGISMNTQQNALKKFWWLGLGYFGFMTFGFLILVNWGDMRVWVCLF
jgi:hypothetical protein